MREGPTDEDQLQAEPTDASNVGDPAAKGAPLLSTVPRSDGFEHRRIVGSARRKLFGRGQSPKIGRYRIERRIGAGGMGEVYLATDDDLGRSVAIKRVLATSTNERHQQRLRREARALARLSHPNVVQVYEVGEHDGQTFIAMEYVHGQTLGQWLATEPRPWRSVLELFLHAGRGLAAAHAAGLIHRDFKPDNVLLGNDGSVRVADFGLVLGGEASESATPTDASSTSSPAAPMSVTGPLRGTIRYMPLEQLVGSKIDARSDQFSFCVALYEALWGTPPFSLTSSFARIEDLRAGTPASPRPSKGRRTPSTLWRILRRGLSREPQARWPDIDSLLIALEHVMARRRRLAWVGSAGLASVLIGGGLAVGGTVRDDPCAAVEHELDDAWSDTQRAQLDTRFAALAADHASGSLERVIAGLDGWSSRWVDEREQACRAQAEQRVDPERGRQRNLCLTRQRQRVEDLVALLAAPSEDGETLAHAVEAVAELPPASACNDELALLGIAPPPPELHDDVEAIRRDLGRAKQLRLLGRVEDGLRLAEHSEQAANDLEYGPLLAEALAEYARAEFAAGSQELATERIQHAIDSAELNGHDHLLADLWTTLTLHTVFDSRDVPAGLRRHRRAVAATGRVDAPPRIRARVALSRGQLAELQGDEEKAEQSYREALTQSELDAAAAIDRPSYLSNLAHVVIKRDTTEGLSLYRAAVEASEQSYGVDHPVTADHQFRLATVLRDNDRRNPEAVSLMNNAARVWTHSHIKPHRDLAKAKLLLGMWALQRRDLKAAEEHANELVRIQSLKSTGDDSLRGETAHLLATIHGIRGESEQAIEHLQTALSVWGPMLGPDATQVTRLRSDLAAALLDLDRLDEASEVLDALLPHVQGRPSEVFVRIQRSETALRRGRLVSARKELQLLVGGPELGAHEFSHALLSALIELRSDSLLQATVDRLHAALERTTFLDEQIDAWMAALDMSDDERAALGFH